MPMISPDFPLIFVSNVRMSSDHLTSISRRFSRGLLVTDVNVYLINQEGEIFRMLVIVTQYMRLW